MKISYFVRGKPTSKVRVPVVSSSLIVKWLRNGKHTVSNVVRNNHAIAQMQLDNDTYVRVSNNYWVRIKLPIGGTGYKVISNEDYLPQCSFTRNGSRTPGHSKDLYKVLTDLKSEEVLLVTLGDANLTRLAMDGAFSITKPHAIANLLIYRLFVNGVMMTLYPENGNDKKALFDVSDENSQLSNTLVEYEVTNPLFDWDE